MHWFIDPIKNHYADFEGRVGRQDFWMFILFCFVLNIIFNIFNIELVGTLVSLALLLPTLAITTRRLHDIGKSGWWQLVWVMPIIGGMAILIVSAILFGGEFATVMSFMLIIPFMIANILIVVLGVYFLMKETTPADNQFGTPAKPKLPVVTPVVPAAAQAAVAPVATDATILPDSEIVADKTPQ